MTLPAHLSPIILSASINQIAPLFMQAAGCDEPASRDTVTALLTDFEPKTNDEVTLAADIVHYRILAVDNLVRSVERDLPVTQVLRLRASAVALNREAQKTRRTLEKLQSARTKATAKAEAEPQSPPQSDGNHPVATQSTEPTPTPPTPVELAALHAARDILKGMNPGKAGHQGGHAYAQQLRKRIMTQTITQNGARRAAETARCAAETARQAADQTA